MPNGVEGWGGYYLSAYGLAVKHGFHGSEAEWLEFLRAGEVEIKVEDSRMFWKTDKQSSWTEIEEYAALINAMKENDQSAKDAVKKAQADTAAAVSKVEAAITRVNESFSEETQQIETKVADATSKMEQEISEKFSEKETELTQFKTTLNESVQAAVSAEVTKAQEAVAEIEALSEQTEEIRAVNEQAISAAQKVDNLVTVSRIPLVENESELETGKLYLVY